MWVDFVAGSISCKGGSIFQGGTEKDQLEEEGGSP